MHLISVEEAQKIVLQNAIECKSEHIPLENALGRVLLEKIVADRDFPPFDRVSMDGIAIQYADFEAENRIFKSEGLHTAGSPNVRLDAKNTCFEVMTGAILPQGTDTVIRYEDLKETDLGFEIQISEIKKGQNVHNQGIDKQKDDVLIPKHTVLNAHHLAVAASVGKAQISVFRNPKIAFVSTGDELVAIDETPKDYQIRRSNQIAVSGMLQKLGFQMDTYHLKDNKDELFQNIKSLMADYAVLVFSGGVSMGKKDFLPEILLELGVEKQFHKVAQKPGKPFWFGKYTGGTVFALPGNPTSTVIGTVLYLIPWLKSSLKIEPVQEKYTVILKADLKASETLDLYVQAKLKIEEGKIFADPIKNNGSGDFFNLVDSDGFIHIPKGFIEKKQGDMVEFLRY
ncbi:MAG: molybdopterin molybdotransferase MoeA [Leadbetterella sp.]